MTRQAGLYQKFDQVSFAPRVLVQGTKPENLAPLLSFPLQMALLLGFVVTIVDEMRAA